MLAAQVERAGGEVANLGIAPDDPAELRIKIGAGLVADVLVLSGGVSAGKRDLVPGVLAELGVRALFHQVAMKPGKPVLFGVCDRTDPTSRRALVFGLPGNPVSSLVCFELFVRPALAALQGARQPGPAFRPAALAAAVERSPDRDEMVRVRALADGRVEPLHGQQSHQLVLTAAADGLARIPAGSGTLRAGTEVDYLALLGGAS
jgi:molybdopterin molybdotransferase